MHFAKSTTIVVTSVFLSAVVHSVVLEAPLSHTRVDVVFVGVDDCPDSNRGAHQWLDRYLLDVCQHLNNHFAFFDCLGIALMSCPQYRLRRILLHPKARPQAP